MVMHRDNKSKQRVRPAGENVELTLSFSKKEYTLLRRVADKRKRSIRSMILKMFYDMDFKQEAKRWV
ncbi:MAG: hypothetical protein U0L05_01280 [Schaedlerella sp.]|nr:hypothetical protein [Schaedlerella sp.]